MRRCREAGLLIIVDRLFSLDRARADQSFTVLGQQPITRYRCTAFQHFAGTIDGQRFELAAFSR
jgi:hypothetical protein